MVEGPRGFLGYHGPTPGYTQLVLAYSKVLRLRVARAVRRGAEIVVERQALADRQPRCLPRLECGVAMTSRMRCSSKSSPSQSKSPRSTPGSAT